MNNVRTLHQEAMDLAEAALVARLEGDLKEADRLTRLAFEKEVVAAKKMSAEPPIEPSRSVLYRSAASLAIECGEFREAERLLSAGLCGDPPEEVAEELRDLLEKATFERHLRVRGVTLDADEIQMSMAGKAIGSGMVPSDKLISRIEDARRLVLRTAERLLGKPYRDFGAAHLEARDYGLYISVPRPASFAVSLKVTSPKQPPLPGFQEEFKQVASHLVVDEIMTCLELFSKSQEGSLHDRISDSSYYRNFVGIAKSIAPDGNDVTLVGFTAVQAGKKRTISLSTPRTAIAVKSGDPSQTDRGTEARRLTLTGVLRYADATHSARQKIKLIDETGKAHIIVVPEGMMSDIVKPLWDESVEVVGLRRGKDIYLEDIRRSPETAE